MLWQQSSIYISVLIIIIIIYIALQNKKHFPFPQNHDDPHYITLNRHQDQIMNPNEFILCFDLLNIFLLLSRKKKQSFSQFKIKNKKYYIKIRPFIKQFLGKISNKFKLYLYSELDQELCDSILHALNLNEYFPQKRCLYNKHCYKLDGVFKKLPNHIYTNTKKQFYVTRIIMLITNKQQICNTDTVNYILVQRWKGGGGKEYIEEYCELVFKAMRFKLENLMISQVQEKINQVLNIFDYEEFD